MPYETLPVYRAVNDVLSNASNTDTAITGVLEAIGDSMGWLVGAFWTEDRETGGLEARVLWAARIHKGTAFDIETRQLRLSHGAGLPGRVWTTGKTVWIEDVEQDPDFAQHSAARIYGLHAAVGFPVQDEGHTLGVLEFFTDVLRAPVEALLPVFDAIGRRVGEFVARGAVSPLPQPVQAEE